MRRGTPKWHIDTLDGRGGLAFTSWRPSNLQNGVVLFDCPTFYLSPPDFAPIPIASSATALAAERFGFQLGLFDDEGEIPFENVTHVAEFVRRVYIGSGRSDGTDGGGIGPVPPPTGEPPDIPGGTERPRGEHFAADALEFLSSIENTSRGDAKSADWHRTRDKEKGENSRALIIRGAELTLVETLSRFPFSRGKDELEIWEASARRLAVVLMRIGILPFRDDQFDASTWRFCRDFLHRAGLDWRDEHSVTSAIAALTGSNIEYWWHGYSLLPTQLTSNEPLDDLAHFPISAKHASIICAPNTQRAKAGWGKVESI